MTDERLDAALAALPREIDPARDLWPDIRARIVGGSSMPGVRPPSRRAAAAGRHLWLRAAALLLGALGAGAGVLAVRGTPERPAVATAAAPTPVRLAADGGLATVLAQYDAAARDLAQAFGARRAGLDPAARAAVERALRTIDDAIADLQAALATRADPAAGSLLEGAYRQKIDLLNRALRL